MTKNEKLKFARQVLITQDRISLRYRKIIAAELKRVSKELSESYEINQSNHGFADIQQQHKQKIQAILTDLATDTANRFKTVNLSKKNLFDNFVENGIYDFLAQNAIIVAANISTNTIAIASAVIMQSMAKSITDPYAATPQKVAKNIAARIGGVNAQSRAMTIARTETHKAANYAQYTRADAAAQESGLQVQVEWISTNDGRVRDDHKQANGQKRPIGQPFNVGGELMMHPSAPNASAKNTINCRCVLGYDVV